MFIMFTIIEIMKVFFSSSILNTCSFTFSKYSASVWNSLRWIFKSRHCFSIVENILSFITQITCCCYYRDYTMAKWSGKFFLKKYSKAIFLASADSLWIENHSFCSHSALWPLISHLPSRLATTHIKESKIPKNPKPKLKRNKTQQQKQRKIEKSCW